MKHLSFDTWTSPNDHGFLAVVVHFIDQDLRPRNILLGLARLEGAHTGENQAAEILNIVRSFKIEPTLSHFQADNFGSSDTLVRSVVSAAFPSLSKEDLLVREKVRELFFIAFMVVLGDCYVFGDIFERPEDCCFESGCVLFFFFFCALEIIVFFDRLDFYCRFERPRACLFTDNIS